MSYKHWICIFTKHLGLLAPTHPQFTTKFFMATFPKGADNPMGTPKGHTVSTLEYTKVILQKNLDTDLSYIYTRSKN